MSDETSTSKRKKRGWPLRWMLTFWFGLLLLVSVGSVLYIGLSAAGKNTATLLQDQADLGLASLEGFIRTYLDPAQDAVQHLSKLIKNGQIKETELETISTSLRASLAGVPQIVAIGFVGPDLRGSVVVRTKSGFEFGQADVSKDKVVLDMFGELSKSAMPTKPLWVGPIWRDFLKRSILVVRVGVERDGKLIGAVFAMVSVTNLSRLMAQLGQGEQMTAFILKDRRSVVAHSALTRGFAGSKAQPLPMLKDVIDPVLRRIWDPKALMETLIKARPPLKTRVVEVNDTINVFFLKQISGYGPRPWTIGVHIPAEALGGAVERLVRAAIAGAVALIVSILLAFLIGGRLARPVRIAADAARRVADLRIEEVQPLPGSRIRELNEQSNAFNAMLRALRWFEIYVPRPLVRHLMLSGDTKGISSDKRNLTVMFTDIVGFSRLAEGKPASEVASFLNDHFSLIAEAIEEEGGTVDKFIGDSIMAFWGAPEKTKQRAEHACRAAVRMIDALKKDNEQRAAKGFPPTKMRVGIHSGVATVANIGTASRANYTAIGDMVNVAQRMEQLGKELVVDGRDVTILISEATREDISGEFTPKSLGRHNIRGREEAVEVFDLAPPMPA